MAGEFYDQTRGGLHQQLEEEAKKSRDEKMDRITKSQEARVPRDDADFVRGTSMGLHAGSALTDVERDNGDAKFVPPRHSKSGQWEVDGRPVDEEAAARAAQAQEQRAANQSANQQSTEETPKKTKASDKE